MDFPNCRKQRTVWVFQIGTGALRQREGSVTTVTRERYDGKRVRCRGAGRLLISHFPWRIRSLPNPRRQVRPVPSGQSDGVFHCFGIGFIWPDIAAKRVSSTRPDLPGSIQPHSRWCISRPDRSVAPALPPCRYGHMDDAPGSLRQYADSGATIACRPSRQKHDSSDWNAACRHVQLVTRMVTFDMRSQAGFERLDVVAAIKMCPFLRAVWSGSHEPASRLAQWLRNGVQNSRSCRPSHWSVPGLARCRSGRQGPRCLAKTHIIGPERFESDETHGFVLAKV